MSPRPCRFPEPVTRSRADLSQGSLPWAGDASRGLQSGESRRPPLPSSFPSTLPDGRSERSEDSFYLNTREILILLVPTWARASRRLEPSRAPLCPEHWVLAPALSFSSFFRSPVSCVFSSEPAPHPAPEDLFLAPRPRPARGALSVARRPYSGVDVSLALRFPYPPRGA